MLTTVGIALIVLGVLTIGVLVGVDRSVRRFLLLGLGQSVAPVPAKSLPWLFFLVVVSACATQQ